MNCPFRLQRIISTRRGLDVEMVMEDALEDPKSNIKLTPICGFRSTTPTHSDFQNCAGFKNKREIVKPLIVEVS